MTSYFEAKRSHLEFENVCWKCKWMDVVNANDTPCCYCEEYGGMKAPIDFDYVKLRSEKL